MYKVFCEHVTAANRKAVLDEAKALDKLMTAAPKKAAASAGGFSVSSPASRAPVAGGATLDDINNNLRLLVDAVRRLAEVGGAAVRLPLACLADD